METRKDKRGRILFSGESQRKDGRYEYRFIDTFGERQTIYSWRLTAADPMPRGKKQDIPLREKEKKIAKDLLDRVSSTDGKMSVLELVETYDSGLRGLRPTTMAGHKTVRKLLGKDEFGKREIESVRTSDAKSWLIKLQTKDKKSYSSIHTIRGVLKPAFQMAVDDDVIRKNPFDFQTINILINDTKRRDALSEKDERKFLDFVKADKHYSKYYEAVFILLNTGLRISEFTGLTISDVDLWRRRITVQRQLLYTSGHGAYIQETKTERGKRIIPISSDVAECFDRIIKSERPKVEPMVDGVAGFLYITERETPYLAHHWEKIFQRAVEKHNKIFKNELPRITPHVCRHTYCTKIVKRGLSTQTVQYVMGHSDPSTTFRIYTHYKFEDAEAEMKGSKKVVSYD